MDPAEKRTCRLHYLLTDLESALRKAGRPLAAENIGTEGRRASSVAPAEFLNNCREALEAVLLGERDLGKELIEQILQATALVDEILMGLECKDK